MRVLLPFNDDSTLFFVSRFIEETRLLDAQCVTFLEKTRHSGGVSKRQMDLFLSQGPDLTGETIDRNAVRGFDAVVICKPTKHHRSLLGNSRYVAKKDRPCFIAFQPGLEFTPEKGNRNRRNFDVVFLNRVQDVADFGTNEPMVRWRHVSWGHPYFLKPSVSRDDTGGPVYFFAQSISPKTYAARKHVAEVLRAIALANPQRKIIIKLRHLPNENTNHVHQELFSYPDVLKDLTTIPDNIELSACPMDQALEHASLVLTCTSTAAMDAISAGLPTLVYTDFVENYFDPMSQAMNTLFQGSGVLSSLNDLLHLRSRPPKKEWVEQNFRDFKSIFAELESAVQAFKNSVR